MSDMNRVCVFVLISLVLISLLYVLSAVSNWVVVRSLGNYPIHNIDSGRNYTTIQEALDANDTLDGHTILVDSGVYNANVIIRKSVFLVGENAALTVLDGEGESLLVLGVLASDVAVCNFTVRNTRMDQPAYGVSVKDCWNVSLVDVTIKQCYTGLVLANASYCGITDDVFMDNYAYGIDFRDNSKNSTAAGNWIVSNPTGIRIMDNTCRNNRFHHNNFMNNTNQIDVTFAGPNTKWDDGKEGNFWSNFAGIDADFDGIGDTPFGVDNCPLMGTFSAFHTFLGYDVNVISNSTVEYFHYSESNRSVRIRVSNSSAIQVSGFCRVCIPHFLINPLKMWIVLNNDEAELLFANIALEDNVTHRWIYFIYSCSTREILLAEDNTPPVIERVYQQPTERNVYPDDEVKVYTNVTDDVSKVKVVILNYSVNDLTWFMINMTNLEGTLYNATIQKYEYCTNITYIIIAKDNANNTIATEKGYEYQYHVIPEFQSFTIITSFILTTLLVAIIQIRKHVTRPN